MKKILVTGGAGFLGSHLCERLHGRNQYDPGQVRGLGFEYFGIGR